MPLSLEQCCSILQHTVQGDLHLWEQTHVCMLSSNAGHQGNVSAVSPHKLDQANAVPIACCFNVGRIDGLLGLGTCRVEAEGPVEKSDVVVNGFGYANNSTLPSNILHCTISFHGTPVRAISTNHEVLTHTLALQCHRHVLLSRISSICNENSASSHVDVPDVVRSQCQPCVGCHHTLVATFDAVDFPDTVCIKHHDHLSDDRVQARAEPSACDDRSNNLLRLKVKRFARSSSQHLHADCARNQRTRDPRALAEVLQVVLEGCLKSLFWGPSS
mmetsp:Transcript_38980/g.91793  ORF Transcript_38980/g.91793 Transcript_38980/m.91793 type:complete len:273 (-) Transcript_38980:849-1667(-)